MVSCWKWVIWHLNQKYDNILDAPNTYLAGVFCSHNSFTTITSITCIQHSATTCFSVFCRHSSCPSPDKTWSSVLHYISNGLLSSARHKKQELTSTSWGKLDIKPETFCLKLFDITTRAIQTLIPSPSFLLIPSPLFPQAYIDFKCNPCVRRSSLSLSLLDALPPFSFKRKLKFSFALRFFFW